MHFFTTRYYVPGKLLWGALTAKLTPMFNIRDYQKVGVFFKDAIRFGYLYLHIENKLYLPNYTEKGLMIGQLSKNEFEKKVISSLKSTAIDSKSSTAEEETLHEVEFINPYSIDNGKPVFLKGYLWIREISENGLSMIRKNGELFIEYNGLEVNFRDELANRIQVGGERKYGFGLIESKEFKQVKYEGLDATFGEWFEKDGAVYIKLTSNKQIWSHTSCSNNIAIRGNIEPLVGRNWDIKKGSGRKLDSRGLFWAPGSILDEDKTFKILEFGLWNPL